MICSKHANVQNKLLVMQYICACQYVKNLYLVATVFFKPGTCLQFTCRILFVIFKNWQYLESKLSSGMSMDI